MNRLPSYGYLLLLASLLAFSFCFFMRHKERAKKEWPTVPGTVLESTVLRTTEAYLQTPMENRKSRDDKFYRQADVWALQATYEYKVQGQTYTSVRATSTDHVDAVAAYPDGPSPQMIEWKDQLHPGAAVQVHYDPSQPWESYLIYTESTSIRTDMLVGCVLACVGIALVLVPRFVPSASR